MNNTSLLRITATAGTYFGQDLQIVNVIINSNSYIREILTLYIKIKNYLVFYSSKSIYQSKVYSNLYQCLQATTILNCLNTLLRRRLVEKNNSPYAQKKMFSAQPAPHSRSRDYRPPFRRSSLTTNPLLAWRPHLLMVLQSYFSLPYKWFIHTIST